MDVGKYFDITAEEFDQQYDSSKGWFYRVVNSLLRKPGLIKRMKVTLDLMGDVRGKSVLDIGCGPGHLLINIAKKGALKVVGIDLSPKMINIAKNKLREGGIKNGKVKVVNTNEEFPRGFDIITALGVIEYYEEPLDFMLKLIGSLNQDGKLIVSVPNKYAPQTLLRKFGFGRGNIDVFFHTKKELIKLFCDCDLQEIMVRRAGPGLVGMGVKR